MNVSLQINTLAGQRKMDRLLQAMKPEVLLTLIGGRLLSYVDQQFKTRGGGRWKALSQGTLDFRTHGGGEPLQDTGRYKQSFVQETDSRTFVAVGTNLKTSEGQLSLGKIHEFGTAPYVIRVKRAKVLAAKTRAGMWVHFGKEVHHPGIPARPVLPTKAVAERLVLDVVNGALKRAAELGQGPSPGGADPMPAVFRSGRRGGS